MPLLSHHAELGRKPCALLIHLGQHLLHLGKLPVIRLFFPGKLVDQFPDPVVIIVKLFAENVSRIGNIAFYSCLFKEEAFIAV